jgi:hypothetical protein
MTESRDPIQQYLDQLRLSLRIPKVGRILVEAEDHLREAAATGMAAGLTERAAQQAAISSFGPVRAIVYAHQTRRGRVAAMVADLAIALWRVATFYLLADFAIGLAELFAGPGTLRCTDRAPCVAAPLVPGTTVAAVIVWAAMGTAGSALLVAYFIVRRFQRRRGRVWSVPLGGYFPLAATIASVLVVVGMVVLSTYVAASPGLGVIGLVAIGLAVTYGGRMWQMLRQQARGWGELA